MYVSYDYKALEDWFNENLDKKTNLIDEEIKKGLDDFFVC